MTNRLATRLALAASAAGLAAPALADTQRNNLPQIYTMSPLGVNMQSGIFMHSRTDFSIGPLAFVRSYRTVPSYYANVAYDEDHLAFGRWDHNFGYRVYNDLEPEGLLVRMHVLIDGQDLQFIYLDATTGWQPYTADTIGTSLTQIGGVYVFRGRNGDVMTMRSDQLADRVERADGSRLDFTYDSSSRLRTVKDNRGYALVLDYGSNGRLATACGYNLANAVVTSSSTCSGAPVQASYGYGTTSWGPVLTSVTGPDGAVTAIQYDGTFQRNLACITIPNSSTCEVSNLFGLNPGDQPDQVSRQTTATGEVWNYYYMQPNVPVWPDQNVYTATTMVDPQGRNHQTYYNRGFITYFDGPEGRIDYEWYGTTPSGFTYPGGNRVILGRDNRGNLVSNLRRAVPGSGLADIGTNSAFPIDDHGPGYVVPRACVAASQKLCDKPIYSIDANGNRTDFTYDAAHGGVLTATGPAVNGIRPQTRYTYVQRQAWISNGSGFVQSGVPIALLASEARCITSAAHSSGTGCTASNDEVVTTYDYGPDNGSQANNLLLRGTVVNGPSVTNARTCYGYDARGNRISEIGPGAGLTSCP